MQGVGALEHATDSVLLEPTIARILTPVLFSFIVAFRPSTVETTTLLRTL